MVMKIRQGFVSNSSSSSFIINKLWLHQSAIDSMSEDIGAFINRLMDATGISYPWEEDCFEKAPMFGWTFEEHENIFAFETGMDNFDMQGLFNTAGIPTEFLGYHYDWDVEATNKKVGTANRNFLKRGKE